MNVPDNQVDLWCAFSEDGDAPALERLHRSVLSPDEAQRAARFHFQKDRRQFLLTRALVRDVLSRYVGVKPSALAFARSEYGKPSLADPARSPVAFSLSHTKGLSVCAVAPLEMIGVDVERLDRTNCHPEVANRFFAPAEAAYLKALEGDARRLEFLRLWTLKEAFVKARGKGLSIPLTSFQIGFAPGRPVRVSFDGGGEDDAWAWRFLQVRLEGRFHIAIAIRMRVPHPVAVRCCRIVPLAGEEASILLEPNAPSEWTLSADASWRKRRGG